MRVLYLEDSELDVKLMQQYMESVNHQFTAAVTISEARQYLQKQRPDIFLIDIMIDGEIADELITFAVKQRLSKHVVAVTAMALPEEREHYLELGCDDVIAKPFTMDELESTLNQLS